MPQGDKNDAEQPPFLSMSKFATQADYWKARAEKAELQLAEYLAGSGESLAAKLHRMTLTAEHWMAKAHELNAPASAERSTVVEIMGHPDKPVSARCILSGCQDFNAPASSAQSTISVPREDPAAACCAVNRDRWSCNRDGDTEGEAAMAALHDRLSLLYVAPVSASRDSVIEECAGVADPRSSSIAAQIRALKGARSGGRGDHG